MIRTTWGLYGSVDSSEFNFPLIKIKPTFSEESWGVISPTPTSPRILVFSPCKISLVTQIMTKIVRLDSEGFCMNSVDAWEIFDESTNLIISFAERTPTKFCKINKSNLYNSWPFNLSSSSNSFLGDWFWNQIFKSVGLVLPLNCLKKNLPILTLSKRERLGYPYPYLLKD